MLRRRRSRPRRRLRRLLVVGGLLASIGALRGVMLARNEKRFAPLVSDPPATRSTG